MKAGQEDLIKLLRPAKVVEFGSWKGDSALTFLSTAKELNLKIDIVCIDTWLGSIEHWLNYLPDSKWSYSELNIINNEPTFFLDFKKNIIDSGYSNQVSILRASTKNAAAYLHLNKVLFDLIYIDADHTFPQVFQDLIWAEKIRAESGYLSGDDYYIPSVRLSVLLFCVIKRKRILLHSDLSTYLIDNRGHQGNLRNSEFKKVSRFLEFSKLFFRYYSA